MSRRAARFTEADAFRAAKAAKRVGMAVEIDPNGVIRIVPHEPPTPPPEKKTKAGELGDYVF
jgi:hypothetical protein